MEKIRTALGKVFDFKGKISRKDFLIVLAAAALIALIAEFVNIYLAMVIEILCIVPLLNAGFQRYRDTGYPGWWCLMLVLVTLSGAALGAVCLAMSKTGSGSGYAVLAVVLFAVAAAALVMNIVILAKPTKKG